MVPSGWTLENSKAEKNAPKIENLKNSYCENARKLFSHLQPCVCGIWWASMWNIHRVKTSLRSTSAPRWRSQLLLKAFPLSQSSRFHHHETPTCIDVDKTCSLSKTRAVLHSRHSILRLALWSGHVTTSYYFVKFLVALCYASSSVPSHPGRT